MKILNKYDMLNISKDGVVNVVDGKGNVNSGTVVRYRAENGSLSSDVEELRNFVPICDSKNNKILLVHRSVSKRVTDGVTLSGNPYEFGIIIGVDVILDNSETVDGSSSNGGYKRFIMELIESGKLDVGFMVDKIADSSNDTNRGFKSILKDIFSDIIKNKG